MSGVRVEELQAALDNARVVNRYLASICKAPMSRGCLVWTGALSGKGHGRFWLGKGRVVIAHRFGYALAHGAEALLKADLISHLCDEPVCQLPEHLVIGSTASNTLEGHERRHGVGSPLRDTRGARGRAVALRDAARHAPSTLNQVAEAGRPLLDVLQTPLFNANQDALF